MNKTKKQKLVVNWPDNTWTVAALKMLNPNEIDITLRFRITQAIEKGQIACIGKSPTIMGRPTLVYTNKMNINSRFLAEAVKNNIELNDTYSKLVPKEIRFESPMSKIVNPIMMSDKNPSEMTSTQTVVS